jgi:hypothetical protein
MRRAKPKPTKTCKACGETFIAKGSRLYCEACSPTGKFSPYTPRPKKSTEKICPCCGKAFTDATTNQRKVYCSPPCNYEYMRARNKTRRAQANAAAREREQSAAQKQATAKEPKRRDRPPVDMMRDYSGDTATPCWTCHMLDYCRSIIRETRRRLVRNRVIFEYVALPCTEPGWSPLGPRLWPAEPQPAEATQQQEARP